MNDATPKTLAERLLAKRFLEKIAIGDGCWQWQASYRQNGYGQFSVSHNVSRLAHRFAYELLVGPIPQGLTIDHLCRNRGCVRPDHLEPVTQRENTLRGTSPVAAKAQQSECVNGHPFDRMWNGKRACKTCRNVASAAFKQRIRARREIT